MSKDIDIINIDTNELLAKTEGFFRDGYRLVQIGCSRFENYEINYSFDKNYQMVNLRLNIPVETEVPSISTIYWGAFVYENEIHDLFGVNVSGLNVNYQGTFYKTAIEQPFNTCMTVVDKTAKETRKG